MQWLNPRRSHAHTDYVTEAEHGVTDTSPEIPDVQRLINQINKHARADETTEDVISIGKGLVELFGFRSKTPKIEIDGMIRLSKRDYGTLGLKIGYSWVKRLMKIAMDSKLNDPSIWPKIPSSRESLHQLSLMSEERLLQGTHPDPELDGEIFITHASSSHDIKIYRKRGEPIHPFDGERYVIVAMPRQGCDWVSAVERLQDSMWDADCDVMLGEKKSKVVKEKLFATSSEVDTTWTIRQIELRKKPKQREEE